MLMKFRTPIVVFLVLIFGGCGSEPAGPGSSGGDEDRATYRVVFDAAWSAATHPAGFPPAPHFSGLIGATHGAGVAFWTEGAAASEGIRVMAETGGKGPLMTEIAAAVSAGDAFGEISGGGINPSPGSVSVNFEVDSDQPLVTLVSMIAPSPDWFVGVRGLPLRSGGEWLSEVTVELFAYDAGTDSGASYTSANQATEPRAPIARIQTSPFDGSSSLGTFTFTRVTASGSAR